MLAPLLFFDLGWQNGPTPVPPSALTNYGSKGQEFHDDRVRRLRLEEEELILFLSY